MSDFDFVVRDGLIHCDGCEQRISNALSRLPGVRAVRADHRTQEVHVTAEPGVSAEDLRARLAHIGFEATTKAP